MQPPMQRHEYAEVVHRGYLALVSHDLESLLALCHDDVVLHVGGDHPYAGHYRAHGGVLRYLTATIEAGDDARFVAEQFILDEATGTVWVECTGLAGLPGEPAYERRLLHQLRIREGRIAEAWVRPFDQRAEDAFWSSRRHLRSA